MADHAEITSVEALTAFRANLIVFLTSAHGSLDSTGDAVRRRRQWLQHDQRLHWEMQIRQCRRAKDLAEQELFSARLSGLRDSTSRQEELLRRAQRAVAHAEEKLRTVKAWSREFDAQTDPLLRRLQGLRDLLDHDLPKALAYLLQAQQSLDAYTETSAPSGVDAQPPTE